jgi:hypothetical protein
MTDTLRAQVAVSIEAEHINDLDLADPVRDIVAETFNLYESSTAPPTDGIWRKRFTMVRGTHINYDLQAGTYMGIFDMVDGFGQVVKFRSVSALQIKTMPLPANPTDKLIVAAYGGFPWVALFKGFAVPPAPISEIHLFGNATLTLQTDIPWPVDLAGDPPAHGRMFDITAWAGNFDDITVEMTIIGQLA